MANLAWLIGWVFACSPVQRIPSPDPPPTVLPPSVARSHYLRGQILAASGDLEGAAQSLSRARVFDIDEPRIVMALGAVAMTRGDMAAARKWMSNAAEMAPERSGPWLTHGRLELAFGEKEVGRNALRKAMELGDAWEAQAALIADELRRDQDLEVSPLLARWTQKETADVVELRRRGELRLVAGDASGSVDDFLAALSLSTQDLSIVTPIVRAASVGRRIAHTLIGLDDIVQANPAAAAAWMTSGLLSSLIGDHLGTVRALEMSESLGAELGPGSRTALERAQQALTEGEPSSPPGRAPALGDPISRAIGLIEQQKWAEGERVVRKSLSTHPDDPRLLYIMSQIYLERDGAAAAVPWIEQVLGRAPDYAPALNLWAWVHAEQGLDLHRAESRAREALQHQPRIGGYWDTLGWVLARQGNCSQGLPILERAVRLSPKDEAVRAHRDSCRAKAGEMDR